MSLNLSDTIVSLSHFKRCSGGFFRDGYASFSHFAMKLFFAAPESALPSLLTALPSHASFLHLFTKLVFAAPASALPSLVTAFVSQVACAIAEPTAKVMIKAARMIRFTLRLPFELKLDILRSFFRAVFDLNQTGRSQ
jgi:hypothetical protein